MPDARDSGTIGARVQMSNGRMGVVIERVAYTAPEYPAPSVRIEHDSDEWTARYPDSRLAWYPEANIVRVLGS